MWSKGESVLSVRLSSSWNISVFMSSVSDFCNLLHLLSWVSSLLNTNLKYGSQLIIRNRVLVLFLWRTQANTTILVENSKFNISLPKYFTKLILQSIVSISLSYFIGIKIFIIFLFVMQKQIHIQFCFWKHIRRQKNQMKFKK